MAKRYRRDLETGKILSKECEQKIIRRKINVKSKG
jgi:hypothetical protein